MDKIKYFTDLTSAHGKQDLDTQNFLDAVLHYFFKAEFFFTLLKAVSKKYGGVVVLPSFRYDERAETEESRMELLLFRVEEYDNKSVCQSLSRQLPTIKNRHGEAACKFEYDKKKDTIKLTIHDIRLIKGDVKVGSSHKHSK